MRASTWFLHAIATTTASLTWGCGGATQEDPGAVHEGKGVYTLSIERKSDDCQPPLPDGYMGMVVVFVATGGGADGKARGANVPLGGTEQGFDAARSDVRLDEPLTFSSAASPACAEVTQTTLAPLQANGAHIDLEWTLSRSAPCGEGAPPASASCTSDRVLHFQWLHACSPDDHSLDPCP
jgi:hypothetical protein